MAITLKQQRAAKQAMHDAIDKVGGRVKMAELCGIRRQSVDKWLKRGYVSHLKARTIERATGISTNALRPDIF